MAAPAAWQSTISVTVRKLSCSNMVWQKPSCGACLMRACEPLTGYSYLLLQHSYFYVVLALTTLHLAISGLQISGR